tara:strand:- start:175 stop:477 length:303 start_codon:yes stop_codon:yes gene_type:complete
MVKKIKEEEFNPKLHVKEYKRKCNECNKIWHSLASREKEIKDDIKCSGCIGATTACGSPTTSAQSIRTGTAQQDILDKLRKCPKCGSRNYVEKTIIYEKK